MKSFFNAGLGVVAAALTVMAAIKYTESKPEYTFIDVAEGAYDASGLRLRYYEGAAWVVEFADYQCEYCRDNHEAIRSGVLRLNIIHRHFPVSQHRFARQAAAAAECAAEQSALLRMHDLLYEKVDSFGLKTWTAFAAEAEVADTVSFAKCLDSDRVRARIAEDIAAAKRLGVVGTPTFYYRGRLAVGVLSPDRARAFTRKRRL